MCSLFRKSNPAEGFIWTDGRFKEVIHDKEKNEIRIEFIDYLESFSVFTFLGVNDVFINDPIYCGYDIHEKDGKRKKIILEDEEDAVVVSFSYETVKRNEG